jgi:peptidoglycan/xylan/chitin deacetylase (PgdA/CDA1 family)
MVRRADQAYGAVAELSALLGADGIEVAAHDRPISPAELGVLKDAGVRIENHGWSHVEISGLTDDEFAEHVTAGREWLRRELSVDATLYAVPFGADDVPGHRRPWVGDGYFLASRRFPPGRLGPLCWNRKDLVPEMRGQERLRAYLAAKVDQRRS